MSEVERRPSAPSGEGRRRFVPLAQQEGVILNAAAGLFLARGYEGVSIDAITAAVGGSKRDIYGLFGNKEALFRAVIAHLARARASLVRDLSTDGDLCDALTAMGIAILAILLAPETLALHRLIVAEAARVPESAVTFLENGPIAAQRAVEDLLRLHAARSGRVIRDPRVLAGLFVEALTGGLLLRALLGQAVSDQDIADKARVVVAHLFAGV